MCNVHNQWYDISCANLYVNCFVKIQALVFLKQVVHTVTTLF